MLASHWRPWCVVVIALVHSCGPATLRAEGYDLPETVKVMPVVFVPQGETVPSKADQGLFLKHLAWTRKRFGELLDGDTFEMAQPKVEIVRGAKPLDFYRAPPERGAPDIVAELLAHFRVSRFENPYVFCILLANSRDSFPEGGGRTINGGYNSGGGMMYIASGELHRNKHFQATLQHELGHSFGLAHPDAYGYDIRTSPSLMSYNPAHFTEGFQPSPTPGILAPEDLRGLAMNDRAFAKTTFHPRRDVPDGESLSPRIVPLGPMTLPGLPDFYPKVTTDAGEAVYSKVGNVVSGEIKPSAGPGITYDPANMWHSDKLEGKPATLTFEFPVPIELTGLAIHSQHSGLDHAVTAVQLEAIEKSRFQTVTDQKVAEVDAIVAFPKTRSRSWRVTLEPGPSGMIVLRGVRFLNGDNEVVPHLVPYAALPASAK